jgi:CRISPR type III-B/RAMP module RAMP protein Cmr6
MFAIRNGMKKWAGLDLTACSNLGLRLDRLNQDIDEGTGHDHKDEMLQYLVAFTMGEWLRQTYTHAFNQWKTLMENRQDCLCFTIESCSKVLLGTGNPSVHEFGVNLNKPWGVPYICGSSIKGLASSYLAENGGEDWKKESSSLFKSDYQLELFGGVKMTSDTEKKRESFMGSVLFHDAWLFPDHSSGWFCEDIINVHYPSYYRQHQAPDGTDDPLPVKIAALMPDLRFLVTIQGPGPYLKFVKQVLAAALKTKGIGGKTAVGYGRFVIPKTEDQIEKQIREEISAADTETLVNLYKNHGNDSRFSTDFFHAIDTLGEDESLCSVYLKINPLKYITHAIMSGKADTAKKFNTQAKQIKKNLKNFEKKHPDIDLTLSNEAPVILKHAREKLNMSAEDISHNSLLKKLMRD